MDIIARLCDPVIVMAAGKQLMTGSFEDVVSNRQVQNAYLGQRV